MHSLSVIYYPSANSEAVRRRIVYPVMLHKYANRYFSSGYRRSLIQAPKAFDLEDIMKQVRQEFLPSYIAAQIAILVNPQFADLVSTLSISAKELRTYLKPLHERGVIDHARGRYCLRCGFDSPVFKAFDTGRLSQKKCMRIALQ